MIIEVIKGKQIIVDGVDITELENVHAAILIGTMGIRDGEKSIKVDGALSTSIIGMAAMLDTTYRPYPHVYNHLIEALISLKNGKTACPCEDCQPTEEDSK